MNKECQELYGSDILFSFRTMFDQLFPLLNATIVVYGSACFRKTGSDLDVCFITENEIQLDEKERIVMFIKQFSIENELQIDEEVPYLNKLFYSISEIDTMLNTNPFLTRDGCFQIDDIIKEKEFLSSREMKHRLLLNIMTTPHIVIEGDDDLVEQAEKNAWRIIIESLVGYYNITQRKTAEDFIKGMYRNQVTKKSGEYFLGYKEGDERRHEYILSHLSCQLATFYNSYIDASMNVNPYMPTISMKSFLRKNECYSCYPENKDLKTRTVVGNKLGLQLNQIIMTNGSMEGIHLSALLFSNKMGAVFEPSFWGYQNRFEKLSINYRKFSVGKCKDDYKKNIVKAAAISDFVMISNPNNPTLDYISPDEIEPLLKQYPKCTFIVDETLVMFSINFYEKSCIRLIRKYENIIVLLSLSKIGNIAGLRCGFLCASSTLINEIQSMRPLYSSSPSAQRFVSKYIGDIVDCDEYKKMIHNNFALLKRRIINNPHVIDVLITNGAFMLVFFDSCTDAHKLNDYLNRKRILIKQVDVPLEVGGCSFRISPLKTSDVCFVAEAINSFFICEK